MLNKTINISNDTYGLLSDLACDDDTMDDVIINLIVHYNENEEFTDAQAEFYNKEIEKIDNGEYDNDGEILTVEDIQKRMMQLKKEIGNEL